MTITSGSSELIYTNDKGIWEMSKGLRGAWGKYSLGEDERVDIESLVPCSIEVKTISRCEDNYRTSVVFYGEFDPKQVCSEREKDARQLNPI